jgi:uncharacterized SAM-dependent methyltransferase
MKKKTEINLIPAMDKGGIKRRAEWFVRHIFTTGEEVEMHLDAEHYKTVEEKDLEEIERWSKGKALTFEQSIPFRHNREWAVWVCISGEEEKNHFITFTEL